MAEGIQFDRDAAERAIGQGRPRVIDVIRRAFSSTAQPYTTPFLGDDGQPIVLYFSPLTMADIEAIRAMEADKSLSATVQDIKLLILKARDKDGKPAFLETDLPLLLSDVHHSVVRDMVTFAYTIGAISAPEAKDALKN